MASQTIQEQLSEARSALHDLSIGKSVVELWDSNHERVRYTAATRPELLAHIARLERQLAHVQPVTSIKFCTSKGV